jgi:Tol biopolymer transport system component
VIRARWIVCGLFVVLVSLLLMGVSPGPAWASPPGLYTAKADGSGVPALLEGTGDSDAFPAWSPDGSKIAFESQRDGNYEIYTMNADGSGLTRLTYTSWSERFLVWSPDGTKIAFESRQTGNVEVFVMNANGTGGWTQ